MGRLTLGEDPGEHQLGRPNCKDLIGEKAKRSLNGARFTWIGNADGSSYVILNWGGNPEEAYRAERHAELETAVNIGSPPGGFPYGLGDRHYWGRTRWVECHMGWIQTANLPDTHRAEFPMG